MTGTEFAEYIRTATQTNSTTFTDAQIISYTNAVRNAMCAEIREASSDLFVIPYTDDLVANQREYPLPENAFENGVKQIELKLDGTNFVKAEPFDINNDPRATSESDIISGFSNAAPKYDTFRNSIKIYSGTISAVTGGLACQFFVYPPKMSTDGSGSTFNIAGSTDLSAAPSTTTVGFPSQFHELWADKVSIKYKQNKDRPVTLTEGEQMWRVRMDEQIEILRNSNSDEQVTLVGQNAWTVRNRVDGSEY
jgi:hypothetical protein